MLEICICTSYKSNRKRTVPYLQPEGPEADRHLELDLLGMNRSWLAQQWQHTDHRPVLDQAFS